MEKKKLVLGRMYEETRRKARVLSTAKNITLHEYFEELVERDTKGKTIFVEDVK